MTAIKERANIEETIIEDVKNRQLSWYRHLFRNNTYDSIQVYTKQQKEKRENVD